MKSVKFGLKQSGENIPTSKMRFFGGVHIYQSVVTSKGFVSIKQISSLMQLISRLIQLFPEVNIYSDCSHDKSFII